MLASSTCIALLVTAPSTAGAGPHSWENHPLSFDTVSSSLASTVETLIPVPASVKPAGGTFALSAGATINVQPDSDEVKGIGLYLAERLAPATGFKIQVLAASEAPKSGSILLTTVGGDSTLGDEGYELTITPDRVTLVAPKPAGLFYGVQTLRQLLPPAIERADLQPGPWTLPSGTIRDFPRFAWRGTMLDVARHFFKVDDLKRYIDLMAYYKLNRFHLHLTDDQGWRLRIESWPRLATYGGSTEVGRGPGGHYTQKDYTEIVAYAQSRYITVVPEIDMPGHTNAALASYAELNCDGVARSLYTGIKVGFSSLCVGKEITYKFVDDVVREIAALTPGPYIHIGGDESSATKTADYITFVEKVQAIVKSHGKQVIGWEEIAGAKLLPTSIAQHWTSDLAQKAVQQGAKVIMSPASKTYLDMKYDRSTALGQDWAGLIEVQTGYDWDPARLLDGVSERDILGLEASLWSETLKTLEDIEFMTFPRLPGCAEIGWSPVSGRNWSEYRIRLGAHGLRLAGLGVRFYRSPQVPWQ